MSFISDLINPGARDAGNAAATAAEGSKAITDKLLKIQDMMMGFVQQADQSGMFDPNKASERFNQEWDRQHGQDLNNTTAALGSLGYKPGDSEVNYRLQKEKGQLDQERALGSEAARHQALQEKLSAYGSTNAALAPALSGTNQAGELGVQAGQLRQNANNQTMSSLAGLYSGISPFLRGSHANSSGGSDFYQSW